jgi:hypothetical protein
MRGEPLPVVNARERERVLLLYHQKILEYFGFERLAFNRLKIAYRLGIGFTVCIALFLVMAAMSALGIRSLHTEIGTLVGVDYQRTALATRKLTLPAGAPGMPDLVHELIHFRSDGTQPEHDDLVARRSPGMCSGSVIVSGCG